jgi:hypothetical protein
MFCLCPCSGDIGRLRKPFFRRTQQPAVSWLENERLLGGRAYKKGRMVFFGARSLCTKKNDKMTMALGRIASPQILHLPRFLGQRQKKPLALFTSKYIFCRIYVFYNSCKKCSKSFLLTKIATLFLSKKGSKQNTNE